MFNELSYEDILTGYYLSQFTNYISYYATKHMKPKAELIKYATAAECMSFITCSLVDKYQKKQVPNQLQEAVWKRLMLKIPNIKWERERDDKGIIWV